MSYRKRSYDGRGGFGGPKPVETGKEYDVEVAEISRQGDGIARIQGFVIFVKGGKVGEKTKVKITNVGQRFATAEKVQAAGPQPEAEQAPSASEEEKPKLQDYQSKEEHPAG